MHYEPCTHVSVHLKFLLNVVTALIYTRLILPIILLLVLLNTYCLTCPMAVHNNYDADNVTIVLLQNRKWHCYT